MHRVAVWQVTAHGRQQFQSSYRDDGLATVVRAVEEVLAHTPGDVLVFLPGVGEIRRVGQALATLAVRQNLAVMPLYGDLPAEQQDAVLVPGATQSRAGDERGRDVDHHRRSHCGRGYGPRARHAFRRACRTRSAGPVENLERVCRAAGRTSREDSARSGFAALDERRTTCSSESRRARNPAGRSGGTSLATARLGRGRRRPLSLVRAPRELSLAQAEALLTRLGALVEGKITELGRALVRVPAHPRIARLLVEGQALGIPALRATTAALLSERSPFVPNFGHPNVRKTQFQSESDVVDRVVVLEELEKGNPAAKAGLNIGAAHFVLQAKNNWSKSWKKSEPVPFLNKLRKRRTRRSTLSSGGVSRSRRPPSRNERPAWRHGGRAVDEAGLPKCRDTGAVVPLCRRRRRQDQGTCTASLGIEREWLDPNLLAVRDSVNFDARSGGSSTAADLLGRSRS